MLISMITYLSYLSKSNFSIKKNICNTSFDNYKNPVLTTTFEFSTNIHSLLNILAKGNTCAINSFMLL